MLDGPRGETMVVAFARVISASAALVVAFDTEIQEGRFNPNSLAPVAQLMGVGERRRDAGRVSEGEGARGWRRGGH